MNHLPVNQELFSVLTDADKAQRAHADAIRSIRDYIFFPGTEQLAISAIVENCWLLPEVQLLLQNNRFELLMKEQIIRKAIGKSINDYIDVKEPNVNAKKHRANHD